MIKILNISSNYPLVIISNKYKKYLHPISINNTLHPINYHDLLHSNWLYQKVFDIYDIDIIGK